MDHWPQVGISVVTKLRLKQRATHKDLIASAAEAVKGLRPDGAFSALDCFLASAAGQVRRAFGSSRSLTVTRD
jgi:hypothetical protein